MTIGRGVRNAEIIALIPATLYVAWAAVLMPVFSIGPYTLFDLRIWVIFAGGVVGISSAWAAIITSDQALAHRRATHAALVIGLVVGLADAYYVLNPGEEYSVRHSAAFLPLILVGPLFIAVHQLLRLAQIRHRLR